MVKRKSIGDIVSLDDALPPLYKPAELYNHVCVLTDAVEKQSNFNNTFYHMTVVVEATGEQLIVTSGATQIVAVLRAWIELGKEPCNIVFKKVRNMDWIVSPEQAQEMA